MTVQRIKGSKRLLSITQAVDQNYLHQLNNIDWLTYSWIRDEYYHENSTFRRRILQPHCDLMQIIDSAILQLIPQINQLCNTEYMTCGSVWHLCENGFVCPLHTDGHKPNVMIVYWQTPGPEFGTTFYNSTDLSDIFHEFAGIPNTGFFVNYEPFDDGIWPEMWHASLMSVPMGRYRLLTQYEFQK